MGLFALSAQLRKAFGIIGLLIITLAILWIVFLGARAVYRFVFVKEAPAPVAFFGTLTSPSLPRTDVDLTEASFQVDLPEGSLSQEANELKVFPIPKPEGTLTSLEDAIASVRKVGFRDSPKRVNEAVYSWVGTDNSAATIQMNIASGEFQYRFNTRKDPRIIEDRFKVEELEVIRAAQRFLKRLDSYPTELDNSPTQLNFYNQKKKKRVKVSSFSEANLVEVYFFRSTVENQYPIVQDNPDVPYIRVMLGTHLEYIWGVVEADFLYWYFDVENPSLYPTKSAQQAWDEFQQGKASFVKGARDSYEEIFLEQVSLSYYESRAYQPFAQPIYAISGSGISQNRLVEFVAYVPAVANEYLKGGTVGSRN